MFKGFKLLYIIMYILFLITFVFLGFELFTFNVIPNKYLFIIVGIMILCLLLISLGFKFIKRKIFKVFLIGFELLLIAIGIVASLYIYRTNDFFSNVKSIQNETDIYYVIVEKNSGYKKLSDLNNKNIGIFMENDKATKKLEGKIKFSKVDVENILQVISKFNSFDGVYLNSAYYDLICDENKGFADKVRIIEKIIITSKSEIVDSNVDVVKDSFNILISGIDTGGPIGVTSRSDVNIVMTINPETHEILLTHIPRDFYVYLHGITSSKDKLTHSGIYGVDMTLKTVEDLLDIDINYYIRVNFTTVEKVVDAIGGIDVVSDMSFSEYGYSFKKGVNHLDGENALMFSRIRHVLPGGDRARGKHQEAVITAIFNKVTTSEVLLKDYNKLLSSLSDTFQTNLKTNDFKKIIKHQIDGMYSWNINSISVDGTSSKDYCYSLGQSAYVMIPDDSTVDNAHKYIKGMIGGKRYSEI